MLRQTKNSCHPNQHIIFLWTTLREIKFSECDLGSTSSVQFSCSVVSDSLRPHGLQHARPPCPSPAPGACSNSCPSMVIPSNHLILCRPLLLLPSVFHSIRVFSNEVSSSHRAAKVSEFQLQHQSLQ